jgi:hypothetical protein
MASQLIDGRESVTTRAEALERALESIRTTRPCPPAAASPKVTVDRCDPASRRQAKYTKGDPQFGAHALRLHDELEPGGVIGLSARGLESSKPLSGEPLSECRAPTARLKTPDTLTASVAHQVEKCGVAGPEVGPVRNRATTPSSSAQRPAKPRWALGSPDEDLGRGRFQDVRPPPDAGHGRTHREG